MTTQPCNNQQFQKVSLECSEISEEKFSGTHGTSQEMTTMQQRSEQTSLSDSSKTDIQSEPRSQDACDNLSSELDEPLTYWDVLKSQTSSVWDLLSGDPLGGIDPSQVLCKPKPKKPNPRPWIAFNDLNNSDDAPYENKPKPAIEIGIAFDF